MIPRFPAAHSFLVLLLPILVWATGVRAGESMSAETQTTPALATAAPAAATAEEESSAPPMPALSPGQPYQPLNFYSREQLRGFPAAQVPFIPPWCHGAYIAPPLPRLEGDDQGRDAPVYVAADNMQLDETGESQVAGLVEVRQGQNLMRADRAVITAGRDRLLLSGHVFLQDPAMTIEADSAELALDGSNSYLVNTRYALHAPHIRGSASTIQRKNEYSVVIEGGSYTSCEPGHETWQLISQQINLDQAAGWGSAKHMRLLVNKVPVLYVPYITFPIDKRRRSGVLYPTFSFSNSNGTDIAVPYYFNLDPQYDLLLTPRWIEQRGVLVESELRYLLGAPKDSFGKGTLGIGWIDSDKAYGDEPRHVLRFGHIGNPTPRWQVFADATDVSDDAYLDDLDTQLSVNRETHLVRMLQTRYTAEHWSALARVQGWQTINPTIAATDHPYERLPQLLANMTLPTQHGPIWSTATEYVYFDRSIDPLLANPVGSRVRITPSVRWPLAGQAWQLEPAVLARYTTYMLENSSTDDTPEHLIPTASLDGMLFFERDFRMHDDDWLQTLEPRALLLWTPYEAQDDAPLFDTSALTFSYDQLFRNNRFTGGDRIGDTRQLSLAVESRLFGPTGSEAARFGVGQAFYTEVPRIGLSPLTGLDTTRRSPLVANASWQVSSQWSARTEGQWSPDDGDFVRGSLRAYWQDASFRTLNVGYRYDRPDIDQAELSGLLPVDPSWNIVGRWIFDLAGARTLEALGGIEYESCCWRARIVARRTVDIDPASTALIADEGLVFEVELKGLGSLGDKISSELSSNIPGYEKRRKALD